jgi:hypothetical protein
MAHLHLLALDDRYQTQRETTTGHLHDLSGQKKNSN